MQGHTEVKQTTQDARSAAARVAALQPSAAGGGRDGAAVRPCAGQGPQGRAQERECIVGFGWSSVDE